MRDFTGKLTPRKLEKPQQDVMKISTHWPRFSPLHKHARVR